MQARRASSDHQEQTQKASQTAPRAARTRIVASKWTVSPVACYTTQPMACRRITRPMGRHSCPAAPRQKLEAPPSIVGAGMPSSVRSMHDTSAFPRQKPGAHACPCQSAKARTGAEANRAVAEPRTRRRSGVECHPAKDSTAAREQGLLAVRKKMEWPRGLTKKREKGKQDSEKAQKK